MSRRTKAKRTKSETAFPAPVQTPGQSKSHESFEQFEDHHESCSWWADYAHLRNEGFTWRIAAYIAWASSPLQRRWPTTLKDLATQVLGLRSDKVIYKWRKIYPEIEERVEKFKAEPLLRYRQDVLYALIDVASTHDPGAHNDRKLYLEMTGDYKPRTRVENVTWQDEIVNLLKTGALTARDVVEELGLDDARAILIAAGQAIPASAPPADGDRAGDNPAVSATGDGGNTAGAGSG